MLNESNLILPGTLPSNFERTPESKLRMPMIDSQEKASLVRRFRKDVLDLFNRNKGGQMSRWTYLHDGGARWSKFIESPQYYIPGEEAQLIAKNVTRLAERFKAANVLVDFGSGDEFAVKNKAMPLANALENLQFYVPIDLAKDLLERATMVAKQLIPAHVDVNPVNGDFYRDYVNDSEQEDRSIVIPGGNTLGIMLGSTISNINMMEIDYEREFPRRTVVKNIQRMAELLKKNPGKHALAISWDSNPDLDNALKAYDDPNWHNMITGWLYHVDSVLQPTSPLKSRAFDPEKFHYEGIINPHNFTIQQCVVADKRMEFKLNGQLITVNRGDRYVAVNNTKYPTHFMRSLIEEAGFEPDEHDEKSYIVSKNGRLVMQTFDI